MASISVYVGLGSNLAEPQSQVQAAFAALSDLPSVDCARLSPLYCSKAVGPAGQPDYINAAAHLYTALSPIELLDALQRLEQQQRRVRTQRWGPRTIDLDMLLYGQAVLNTPRLCVPHPYLTRRNFVLAPLLDLEPQLTLPDFSHAREHLADLGMADLSRVDQICLRNHL